MSDRPPKHAAPPKPTPEESILRAPADSTIILWRGSYPDQADRVVRFKTADGYDTSGTPGITVSAPSEEDALLQVKGASDPAFFRRFSLPDGTIRRLPEYTTSMALARQFANGKILIIAIKRKYLVKGSVSEFGWIADWCAPLEAVVSIDFMSINQKPDLTNPKTGRRIIGD